MTILNIFENDAFSVVSLTEAINQIPFKPGRIGQMGLFSARHIETTVAAIESKGNVLRLVPPTPRGGPGVTLAKDGREMRSFVVPHYEIDDAINADEVQGVREFGTADQLEHVAGKVAERLARHVDSFDVTEEYTRLGAIKGIVTYPLNEDGSVSRPALNLFNEFGIAAPTPVEFDFSAADGTLLRQSTTIIRTVGDALGGHAADGIHAFVGDDFFDRLLGSAEVRESYRGTSQAEWLREQKVKHGGASWGVFEFGGIVWENYRGQIGTEAFIAPNEARFFPVGVPGLFQSIYAPADYVDTVNLLGRRLYAKQWVPDPGKRVEMESQMNALQICTRPKALLAGVSVEDSESTNG